jgi:hypothetical protein
MKKDLQDSLFEKYPKLFRDIKYLECDDGWYELISTMCYQIQCYITNARNGAARTKRYNRALKQALSGNISNLEYYYRSSPDKDKMIAKEIEMRTFRTVWLDRIPTQMHFTQIKEKFGTLRAYTVGGDAYCEGVVSMAEGMSGKICEACGVPGKSTKSGWIKTLCKECTNERYKPRNV